MAARLVGRAGTRGHGGRNDGGGCGNDDGSWVAGWRGGRRKRETRCRRSAKTKEGRIQGVLESVVYWSYSGEMG